MHLLFETNQVLNHLKALRLLGEIPDGEESFIKIGTALMCAAGDPRTAVGTLSSAFSRLQRAQQDGLLQVFFDQNGVRRGFAILALLDDEANLKAQTETMRPLAAMSGHTKGGHAWLINVTGGMGQGRAIIRHLRDNFLREHDRLTYFRKINEKRLRKTITDNNGFGFSGRRSPIMPDTSQCFEQFRVRKNRTVEFYHYARLHAASSENSLSIGSALTNFTYPVALQQFRFSGSKNPSGYVSWAMMSENVMDRVVREHTGILRVDDWNSGPIPVIIEEIGESRAIDKILLSLERHFSPSVLFRLNVDGVKRISEIHDA